MKNLELKCLILCLTLLIPSLNLKADFKDSSSLFTNIGLEDGLSQLSVLDIMQDSKGYIWFATRNGLNRFDGQEMVVYKHQYNNPMSLADNDLTRIVEDHDRNIWIGSSKGLTRLNTLTDKMKPYRAKEVKAFSTGVKSLFVDSRHRLLVGTSNGVYLYIPEADTFQKLEFDGTLSKAYITMFAETSRHELVVCTKEHGMVISDLDFKNIEVYNKKNFPQLLLDNDVTSAFEDSKGTLWIATNQTGIVKWDRKSGEIKHFTTRNTELSNNTIRQIKETDGKLFIATMDGVYTLDLATEQLQAHSNAKLSRGMLSHFSIYSLCVDKNGGVWIGTYSGGVNYLSKYNNRFVLHEPSNSVNSLLGIYGNMASTKDNLYISTEGGGLLVYDLNNKKYSTYVYNNTSDNRFSSNIIKTVTLDGNTVWCGSAQGNIYSFDTQTHKFEHFYTMEYGSIYAIVKDEEGSLFFASSTPRSGLVKLTKDGQFSNCFMKGDSVLANASARCLLSLGNKRYLIGTRSTGVLLYDEPKQKFTNFSSEGEGQYKLPSNYVTSIIKTSKGEIWISSFGGGLSLFDPQKGIVRSLTKGTGLTDDEICALVEDNDHNIWFSSNSGISRFNPSTDEINTYKVNSTGVLEFTPHSGAALPDGSIAFSASNGFITFHPDDMHLTPQQSPLVFTGLTVNNNRVSPEGEDGILKSTIDDTETLYLNYNQNNISIKYSALNYTDAGVNQYAIRLLGHDDKWAYVGNRREAFYNNLDPGKYTFEVKASNNDGVWDDDAKRIDIIIEPPVWGTWYAYLFYIIVITGTIVLIMYYLIKKRDLEQALQYKSLEQQQAEEFHQTKLRMFTNFSHELRTPLMLILAPLQELLDRNDLNTTVKNKLNLIYNNSQRLSLLVNQLMDLRKSQAGKLHLKIAKDEMCAFMQEIYSAFNQIAVSKEIDFTYECAEERIGAWYDKSLLEKVVFNLLSNAFKYTPADGKVSLVLKKLLKANLPPEKAAHLPAGEKFVHLIVTDTGKGIPESEMTNIFAPFYQIEDGRSKDKVGTGIGLSLTQSIVDLHHGIIWVENNEDGGAAFHVIFPIDKSGYTDDEIDKDAANRVVTDVIPSTTEPESFELEKKYTVLLVEDNEEVRTYVKECLEPYFFVIEAGDGDTAFNIVVDKYPDIVVSDIMMPGKDGLELCQEIKQDLRTGHIPVILMTARSMVMQIKEGFASGADDYIVKPFNMDVLILRIKNILLSREKLRSLYGKKFSPEALGIEIVSSNDRFTQKFFDVIEKNISNPDLNIELMCKEIGLSRTNLYRKLKAITDLSPVELIRNKRMEIAAKLLVESDVTVSEVSTYVGFNSHAYFTQCFKAVYGTSPSDFLAEHKKASSPA